MESCSSSSWGTLHPGPLACFRGSAQGSPSQGGVSLGGSQPERGQPGGSSRDVMALGLYAESLRHRLCRCHHPCRHYPLPAPLPENTGAPPTKLDGRVALTMTLVCPLVVGTAAVSLRSSQKSEPRDGRIGFAKGNEKPARG